MKIDNTIFDDPKTLQNEKVKLGWGCHPQIITTAICNCLGLQSLTTSNGFPYERHALLKGFHPIKSDLVKGFTNTHLE